MDATGVVRGCLGYAFACAEYRFNSYGDKDIVGVKANLD